MNEPVIKQPIRVPGTNNTTVKIGALCGAVTTVAIWIINTYLLPVDAAPITAEIAAMMTVIVTATVQRFTPSPKL